MSLEDTVSSLRATAHPVRLRIVSLLSGHDLSAADIARELGISQANASYHVRVLAAAGLLVETGSTTIRGGVAKLYTHPWRQKSSSTDGFEALIRAVTAELTRRAALRAETGRHSLTDAELWVAPDTWARVVDLVIEASDLLHSSAQLPRTPDTVHVNMTSALFTMTPTEHHEERPDAEA